jgi:hypothetical protein
MKEFLSTDIGMISAIAAGLILFVVIIYHTIKAASYGRKQWVEAQKQTKILSAMAKVTGVHEATITEILDEKQYAEPDI